MMQVPAWVLVILTVFSSVLTVIGCLCLVVFIKHRYKHRRYKPIGSSGKKNKKYVPGKAEAYFNESFNTETVIPLTYPTTLQGGAPMVFPLFNNQKQKRRSDMSATIISARTRTLKSSGASPLPGLNRCTSLDEQLFRKTFAMKNNGNENKSRATSLLREQESRSSNRETDASLQSVKSDVKYEDYPSPPPISRIPVVDTYYSHSGFFSDDDNSSLHPSTSPGDENIVSYDQEPSYKHGNKSTNTKLPFLTFQIEYQASIPELSVTVKHAFDLQPVVDVTADVVNSYVNLCLVPEDFLWKRTRVVESENDPIYDERFRIQDVLYHKLREYTLCLYVMDTHPFLGERPIGKILYPLSDLRAEKAVDVCQELSPP